MTMNDNEDLFTNGEAIGFDEFKKMVFGRNTNSPAAATEVPEETAAHKKTLKLNTLPLKKQSVLLRFKGLLKGETQQSSNTKTERQTMAMESSHDVDNLCNEKNNAGRAIAIFNTHGDGEKDESLPLCACIYPEYLSGPTCRQRMYRYVIDYERWEKTGNPKFLMDPVNDFEEADRVCKGLERSATAAYNESKKAFVCITVADMVKYALTFRGPYEPSLFIERDIDQVENECITRISNFGVNWNYVDLLNRI